MQVHGPDQVVKSAVAGEYHLGAVAIYLGPIRVVTYSEQDCDALIAAASKAKQLHSTALRPARLVIAGDFGATITGDGA